MVLRPNQNQPQYHGQSHPGNQAGPYGQGDNMQGAYGSQNQYSGSASYPRGSNGEYYQSNGGSQQCQGAWPPQHAQQRPYGDGFPGYGNAGNAYDPHAPVYNPATCPTEVGGHGGPFASSAPPPTTPFEGTNNPPVQDDREQRGLMGALGGAAAGGYAGHKMHHGVLGTLGGAYAGHKLEDAYKQHHQQSLQGSNAPPAQQSPAPGAAHRVGSHAGNFSASAKNIQLDRDNDLIAEVYRVDGSTRLSSISLNSLLTNNNGRFEWCRDGNFGGSAREVHLAEDGRELRAELCTVDGKWVRSSIRLDERISNSDGDLIMLE